MLLKKTKDDFEVHPVTPDPIRAVVVDVTEPVTKDTPYGPKEKFALVLETEMKRPDNSQWAFWIHGYTPSIADKSNFARDAKKIMGVDDLGDEFDVEWLIGKPVKIIIEHRQDGEKVFANHSYISADKGPNPLTPSGLYVRKKDRPAEPGASAPANFGARYTKIETAPAPATESTDWLSVKIHVGQFSGQSVSDLPSLEAVEKLLNLWWPSVAAKPAAADKRLFDALTVAKAKLTAPAEIPAF